VGALDKLEGFASFFGPDFYQLPRNTGSMILKRESWTLPNELSYLDGSLVPLNAGEVINWKVSA
jgi:dihydroorotase